MGARRIHSFLRAVPQSRCCTWRTFDDSTALGLPMAAGTAGIGRAEGQIRQGDPKFCISNTRRGSTPLKCHLQITVYGNFVADTTSPNRNNPDSMSPHFRPHSAAVSSPFYFNHTAVPALALYSITAPIANGAGPALLPARARYLSKL